MPRDAPSWMRKVGLVLLIAWAVVFFLGAIGEILGIEPLRELTDLKGIFLR